MSKHPAWVIEVKYEPGRGFRLWNTVGDRYETGFLRTPEAVGRFMRGTAEDSARWYAEARWYGEKYGDIVRSAEPDPRVPEVVAYHIGGQGIPDGTPEDYGRYIYALWVKIAREEREKSERELGGHR